ncbi:phage tail protein [Weissella ceti]|uniref:Phage tail protein n=1 Tax=Weissella ceti TaxID=759620 RepID=A0ABT3E3L1_9LACO|nr:prophage endopeptidase tail family protein [Weissella ceti]MCW0952999.1 phage tail protein [Weissella ceti]QVK11545.1 phage tail protein [Weissella ceti]
MDKVTVQDRATNQELLLDCIDHDTFRSHWEKNSVYELTFDCVDTGSLSFGLLGADNYIRYGGQTYVIKMMTDTSTGYHRRISITARHIFFELNQRMQPKTKKGDVNFTLDQALSFLFDTVGDGYTYKLHGNFNSNKKLTDFGNTDIVSGLSMLANEFNVYCVYPDNKTVGVYTEAAWIKKTNKSIQYLHNAENMKLDWETENIVNQVYVISTDDKPKFKPFYVRDNESIKRWGIKEKDRLEVGKDGKESAEKQAKRKLVTQPSVSIDVELTSGVNDVYPGEEWTVVNSQQMLSTPVQIVSIEKAPLVSDAIKITLNNKRRNFLDSDKARKRELIELKKETQNTQNNIPNIWVDGFVKREKK